MQRILSQNVDCSDLLQEDTPCRSILVSDHRAFSFLVVTKGISTVFLTLNMTTTTTKTKTPTAKVTALHRTVL